MNKRDFIKLIITTPMIAIIPTTTDPDIKVIKSHTLTYEYNRQLGFLNGSEMYARERIDLTHKKVSGGYIWESEVFNYGDGVDVVARLWDSKKKQFAFISDKEISIIRQTSQPKG